MAEAAAGRGRATLVGFTAVLMWSLLASLTAYTRVLPAFQLLALSFAIGGVLGLAILSLSGGLRRAFNGIPLAAWALGVSGLFGYHFCYFMALRTAPSVEANLINYLWPLLIVLFSALLPAERSGPQGLRWWHMAGAVLGFAGTVLIVSHGKTLQEAGAGDGAGYAFALAAALIWSFYSVLSRRFTHVASTSVIGFCFATALLAVLCHLALETTVWPSTAAQWAAILAMGTGPLGAAFYVWDHGVKHGDIRVLGAAAYAAPLLSTLLLVLLGLGQAGPMLWLACLLITGGAVLAARDLLLGRV